MKMKLKDLIKKLQEAEKVFGENAEVCVTTVYIPVEDIEDENKVISNEIRPEWGGEAGVNVGLCIGEANAQDANGNWYHDSDSRITGLDTWIQPDLPEED